MKRALSEKQLVKWDPVDKDRLVRAIDDLIGVLQVDQTGKGKTSEIFKERILGKIITANIELPSVQSYEQKRALIERSIFNRFAHYSRKDIYMFRRALAAEIRAYYRKPKDLFWFLLPLNVERASIDHKRSFTISGVKLRVWSWAYCQKNLEIKEFISDTQSLLKDPKFNYASHFTPIVSQARGHDFVEAFRQCEKGFDLFRWLVNLLYQFGKYQMQFGGYPRPLAKILPPPTFAAFTEDGAYRGFLFATARYEEYKANVVATDVWPDVRRLVGKLGAEGSRSEVQELIVDALQRYGEALDAIEWRLSFLQLWQILEKITLQGERSLSMSQVLSRTSSLLGQDQEARDLMRAIYETRNSLVHSGVFPDESGLLEVELLKYIVERAINALFSMQRVCTDRAQLDLYYQHNTSNSKELRHRKRLISHILGKRR